MWNKNMILIDNPYHSLTEHNPNGKFCPMGILDYDSYSLDDLYEEWEEWKDNKGRINLTVWEIGIIEGKNNYGKK